MDKLKIFLVDDHGMVRDGLKLIINSRDDLEVIGEASDGDMALLMAQDLRPDVVVMEDGMPGMSGDRAAARLRETAPEVKVLFLTVHADGGNLRRLLRTGARGLVLKMSPVEEFLHALRIVAGGGIYLDPSVAGCLMGELASDSLAAGTADRFDLSCRETEVLRLVAMGYSNKELAARLDVSVRTAETDKVRSMERMRLRSRADVVRFALRQGWMRPGH